MATNTPAGRLPEFLPDGSCVYLCGAYTFNELLEISMSPQLKSGPPIEGMREWKEAQGDFDEEEEAE